ncbi:MAG: MOSC domain-containing protein [Firmicutes bacterium]|nr:MOSC domain-containing protein [Bacillota bacterium]
MGKIEALCLSSARGAKSPVKQANFIAAYGIEGDVHAGSGHRQISILLSEKIREFKNFTDIEPGGFGENIAASGLDFSKINIGAILKAGSVLLEVTQIGKKCHTNCSIFEKTGKCIMPEFGIFAKVLKSGTVSQGDDIYILEENNLPYSVSVITLSDRASQGRREDISGKTVIEICEKNGFIIKSYDILPDEREPLQELMKKICDENISDLIITSGGTGLSPRDITPEATFAIAEKNVPGIAEAMRANSLPYTKKAALSRGVSVIRKNTLIINLPGSPKAVEENLSYIIDILPHALDVLTGKVSDCGRD